MKFNYYNKNSRILLWLFCLLPFLSMAILFFVLGNGLALFLGVVLLILFLAFLYKCTFIHVEIDAKGISYTSLLHRKHIAWNQVKDILIVVRQRRSMPDYYKFDEWIKEGYAGKSHFLLFRTTKEFPANPMFMFSAPCGEDYISVQYRKNIEKALNTRFLKITE